MARVTVEDCYKRVDNAFDLVHLAVARSRQLLNGDVAKVDIENDKFPVVALREIADDVVDPEALEDSELSDRAFEFRRQVQMEDKSASGQEASEE